MHLSFCNDFHPYSGIHQLDIPLEHYTYSMVAQNRSTIGTDKIIVALCTLADHEEPVKVYSIDPTTWEHRSVIVKDDRIASRFVNCVAVTDNLILVVFHYNYAVLDGDLNEINNYCRTSIDPKCRMIFSLTDSFDKADLVLALMVNPFDCKNTYGAGIETDYNTLVMKASIDHKSGKLTTTDEATNQTLLKAAKVDSITEVA